jgi:hypothetical protein
VPGVIVPLQFEPAGCVAGDDGVLDVHSPVPLFLIRPAAGAVDPRVAGYRGVGEGDCCAGAVLDAAARARGDRSDVSADGHVGHAADCGRLVVEAGAALMLTFPLIVTLFAVRVLLARVLEPPTADDRLSRMVTSVKFTTPPLFETPPPPRPLVLSATTTFVRLRESPLLTRMAPPALAPGLPLHGQVRHREVEPFGLASYISNSRSMAPPSMVARYLRW